MPHETGNSNSGKQVVDFNEVRAQKMEEKRRKTERIFFKSLLSVYSVVGSSNMLPIELIDISEDGLSFQIPHQTDKKWPADQREIPLRLYFSQDTYLEIHVTIQNSRPSIEANQRFVRFGCKIDTESGAYPAYQQFVRFLKLYSATSHKDKGDVSVFYL
jgi:hypothetical protein